MTMNCLATPTQRTGEPEAPARASVSERFRRLKWCRLATSLRMSASGLNCGKRRTYSEPARLRDQFTGRNRPKDFDPTSTRKPKQKITACLKPNCGWSKGVRAILGKSQSALRRSRYHQQSVKLHCFEKSRAEPFALCQGQRAH